MSTDQGCYSQKSLVAEKAEIPKAHKTKFCQRTVIIAVAKSAQHMDQNRKKTCKVLNTVLVSINPVIKVNLRIREGEGENITRTLFTHSVGNMKQVLMRNKKHP